MTQSADIVVAKISDLVVGTIRIETPARDPFAPASFFDVLHTGPSRVLLARPNGDRLEAGVDEILRIGFDGVSRDEARDTLLEALTAMYGPLAE